MKRDSKQFRERFKRWQQGESYWDMRSEAERLTKDPREQYDYVGYFNKYGTLSPVQGITVPYNPEYTGNGHYPDEFKLPGHPTFSVESIYSTDETPGGTWIGDNFIHSDYTFRHSDYTNDYLKYADPNAKAIYKGGIVLPEITVKGGNNKLKSNYSERIDSFIPSDNVRRHIAEWEGSDFDKQNEYFKGDAIGVKSKEFHDIMKNNYDGLTQQDLDGLFSTFYNISPRIYRKKIMPYVKNYTEQQNSDSYNNLQNALINRYSFAPEKYKNGIKRRAKADVQLMSNKYDDGKDVNEIPEQLEPLVQDKQFQQKLNRQKQQSYNFNVWDFLYRTNKFRPDVTFDQVHKSYLNTPVLSRNVQGDAAGQYSSSDPNSDFTNGYIKVSNEEDMPVNRTISHEMRHAYDDQLYNVDFNNRDNQYDYLTKREKYYLNEAYPQEAFGANGDETSEIAERLATNADMRSQISNMSGGLIKEDLDNYINNMSDDDLYNVINTSNGYLNRNYYSDEQSEPNQQSYGVDKIYNYLNIDPTNGLLKSILNKNAEHFIRMNNKDFQKRYDKNSKKFIEKYGKDLYDNIRKYQKDKYDWDNGVRKKIPNKEKLNKVRQSILNVAQMNNPIYNANGLLLANKGKDNFKYTNKYINIPVFNKGV